MNNKTFKEVCQINKRAKQRARIWFNLPKQRVEFEQESKNKTS